MEDYDLSLELSRWCLIEAMHVHPEAFVEGSRYFCRRYALDYIDDKPKIGVCERTAKYVMDHCTGDPEVIETRTAASCAKVVGRDIITLMAPEFMDISKAYYIE